MLREIQGSLVEGHPLGPILLKLKLLASRLGSDVLEDWVKHESEGYPNDIDVPDYRKVPVSYTGVFTGPFNSGIRNAPIPGALINSLGGENWTIFRLTQGIVAIDDILSNNESRFITIDASNLILLLQGEVYPGYACVSVMGTISTSRLADLQNAVRARILDLTLALEKKLPGSAEITIVLSKAPNPKAVETVAQITQQVIHGNVTTISNSGEGARFNLSITSGDTSSVIKALADGGISEDDAGEFATIIASEPSTCDKEQPFGPKAKEWLSKNIGKALDGTWNASISVATKILTEAALRYYGLK
nr:hypothetical protein [Methylosinus sp. Sm6]